MKIEDLDLEVKTFNRLKKAGISTVDELLAEMYSPGSKVSQPDAKRCEEVLKAAGIIKYMRGDEVEESDIEPEPLTWDELHSYIGKLVAHDVSTESHRWLKVCWIYDIQDEGDGNLIYNDGSSNYGYVRRSTANGEFVNRSSPSLKHEGQFFALRNPDLPQAQKSSVIVESAEYTKAVALHRRICANAQAAQESLFEVCKGLKEMRDGKLYKELGYQNFEDYTKTEIGMAREQARKYIAVYEAFGENAHTCGQIGKSKLMLLAQLDEPQREEIQQTVNVEDVSVRELKSKIDDLKKANDRLMDKVDEAEKKAAASRKSEESACGKLSILRTDLEMQQQKTKQLESENASLEAQVKELESRPVEVAVEKDTAALEALQKENDERISALENSHTAELEKLKTEYEDKLKNVPVTKEEVVDTKEVFKAYLSNAVDASKRLLDFINANPDEIFKEKARSLFETMQKEVI